jgi:hypothetical protein
MVWHLEFSRMTSDLVGGLASRIPELPKPERRGWSIREVSMMLTFRAEGDRIAHLKVLGEQLLAKAVAEVGDDSSAGAREHLAAVRNWASALDRTAYEVRQEDDRLLIQQAVDPEVEQVLGDTNADLRRTNDAMGLTVRHAHVRDNGGRAPVIPVEALAADIALARHLLDEPPQSVGFSADGPVATAASAVELHLSGQTVVADDDLAWSAMVLLQVAASIAENSVDFFDDSFFSQGADRSAARSLPFLLLPAAHSLRAALGIQGTDDVNELIELNRVLSVRGVSEVRLAYARALDAVWNAPCDTEHLHGRCHHSIALDLVTESFLDSVIGPWDAEAQRRTVARLDPPEASTLDALNGDNIYGRKLTPALRAMGAAAISSACCREDAQAALRSLLSAHQRAMLTYEHGYNHSRSDALVAARAALWQAIDKRDDVVLEYVRNYVSNARVLAEALRALAAAAEERAEAGQHARRIWPSVMDLVLDAAEANSKLFTEHTWGDYAEGRADLVTDDQIARWQRVVDLLVVAGDSRVSDLAD